MRSAPFFIVLLAACSAEANHVGNPLSWPFTGLATAAQNEAYTQRRGQVELFVKSNHPQLIDEIGAGGGPTLVQAMDAARIPNADRPARLLQMNRDLGLYAANPGALVTALMVYGG